MRVLQAAAAGLVVLLAAGCAHTEMAPKPAAAMPQVTRESPMVPPMTTYGCDSLLAMRMGKSC